MKFHIISATCPPLLQVKMQLQDDREAQPREAWTKGCRSDITLLHIHLYSTCQAVVQYMLLLKYPNAFSMPAYPNNATQLLASAVTKKSGTRDRELPVLLVPAFCTPSCLKKLQKQNEVHLTLCG